MPATRSAGQSASTTLQNADWAALRLLNHYRLFLVTAFSSVFYIGGGLDLVGQRDPTLFHYTLILYLICGIVFSTLIRLQHPALETQFYLQAYIDIIVLATLMHASGGVQSGLGILLVFHIAVIGHCARLRYALLFAAITTCMLLVQELYTRMAFGDASMNLSQTAVVGIMLFMVAILTSRVLPARVSNQPQPSRPMDVRQIGELNRRIIQELDSGVLYADEENRIQLINDAAADLLALPLDRLPIHLGSACDPLYRALLQWRARPTGGNRPISTDNGHHDLLPGFTQLSDGGTLIRLQDNRLIRQQLQQLKLASLGRLSASIAHEIRNPLGAISNAIQLLDESQHLKEDDRRLISIAENHTRRINRIIEDVMQLSRRERSSSERIDLPVFLDRFRERFIREHQHAPESIIVNTIDHALIQFDPIHLDQVLWNLCHNALIHNPEQDVAVTLSCYISVSATVVLEVTDNGGGIDSADAGKIFEPFFTTRHSGTGLGLYIIRELCELNNASIDYLPRSDGACFRISLPLAQQMAA